MSQTRLKSLFRILGYVLVAISFGFLGKSLIAQFSHISFADWSIGDLFTGGAATIVYASGLVLLALAWSTMLCPADDSRKFRTIGLVVYSGTALLKYLPGNVFHFVGRNVSGLERECGHMRLVSATLFEIGLSLLTPTLLASIIFSARPGPLPQWGAQLVFLGCIFCFAAVLAGPRVLDRLRKYLPGRVKNLELPSHLPAAILITVMAYLLFGVAAFLISATILPASVNHAVVAATYLLAWLVGYVIPGAPGGVGVREAAMVVLLSPYCPQADALLVAFAMRLVSIIADILLFIAGRILKVATGAHLQLKTSDTTQV